MKIYLLIIVIFLSACNSTPNQETTSTPAKKDEVLTSEKVYFFQHKILPEWTFTTEGKFYSDLLKGDLSHLKMAATEVISSDYASGISTKVIKDSNAILIKFPKPKGFANCYFVLITKSEETFQFYTYEKSMKFSTDDPVIGVVGSWTAEGNHGNLGGRTYTQPNDFVSDILRNKG